MYFSFKYFRLCFFWGLRKKEKQLEKSYQEEMNRIWHESLGMPLQNDERKHKFKHEENFDPEQPFIKQKPQFDTNAQEKEKRGRSLEDLLRE